MKRKHLDLYQSAARDAFAMAASLQWSDPALALEWHLYAIECKRIAQQIANTPARDYVAMVCAGTQSQSAQLSLF